MSEYDAVYKAVYIAIAGVLITIIAASALVGFLVGNVW